jgi:uncharacterized protein YjbJ (UPF0337 family)
MGDKTDRASGKLKETAGKATGDRDLEQEGRDEKSKGKLKKGAKDVKDAFTGD